MHLLVWIIISIGLKTTNVGQRRHQGYMFISIPTNALVNRIKSILKLLRHFSVFLRHLQEAYKLCQLKI